MQLCDIEMFKGLSTVQQSRLFGNMDKFYCPAGTPIFSQGESGDAMYVIDDGSIELLTTDEEGTRNTLAILKAGDVFGEMSMLTETDRTASAIACCDSTLYRLRAETFKELLDHSTVANYFLRLLCARLKQADVTLHKAESSRQKLIRSDFARMDAEVKKLLLCASLLPVCTLEFLNHYLGFDVGAKLDDCSRLYPYILAKDVQPGRIAIHPSVLRQLREMHHEVFGAEEAKKTISAASGNYLSAELEAAAVQVFAENGHWAEACDTAAQLLGRMEEDTALRDAVMEQLRHCPDSILFQHYSLFVLFLETYLELSPDTGLSRLESAFSTGSDAFSQQQEVALYEIASDYCQRLGMEQRSVEYMKRALEVAGHIGKSHSSARRSGEAVTSRSYQLSRSELKSEIGISLALSRTRSLFDRSLLPSVGSWVLALAVFGLFSVLPPFAGFSRNSMLFSGISLAAIILWVVEIVPDYAVALLMLFLWVILKIVTPETALSGFASTSWVYMLGTLALGTAVAKSGLLYRLSLYLLKAFPKTHLGQMLGFAISGLVLNPLIPSSTAKVSLSAPIAQGVSEAMGFPHRGNGAAGLGLGAMVFYGFMTPFFLTGSSYNMMLIGLVPGRPAVSWTQWFIYSLPTLAVFSIGMFSIVVLVFKPEKTSKRVSDEVLNEQLRILGRVTRKEWVTIIVTLGVTLSILLQPLHGIESAWLLLLGLCFLVMGGVLDASTLRSGVDWPFLLFTAVFFSFATILEQMGIVNPLTRLLGVIMNPFVSSPYLFLPAAVILTFFLASTIRQDATAILLTTSICPLAKGIGMHPWVTVMVILLASDPFFYTSQSTTYLTAYYSAEGKSFTHAQGKRLSLYFAFMVVTAVIVSIPFWQMMGLIK